jgi:hypothetical protein
LFKTLRVQVQYVAGEGTVQYVSLQDMDLVCPGERKYRYVRVGGTKCMHKICP